VEGIRRFGVEMGHRLPLRRDNKGQRAPRIAASVPVLWYLGALRGGQLDPQR
jgi:hypothetical protein